MLGPGAGSSAAETLTFGSNLPAPSPGYFDSCSVACTAAQLGLPGTQVVSPVTGTITGFRLRTAAGSDPQSLRFRVLRSADGTRYTGAGTSAPVPISTGAGSTEYPVNLPVEAGDAIGFDQVPGVRANVIRVNPGAFQAGWFPALGDGASPKPSDNPQGSDPTRYELLLQAEVEYDASGQFGCTDPGTRVADCADANGIPSVCGPQAAFPQCSLPLNLPSACSGTGTGLPVCNLPGNQIVACGGFGLNLPVCDLPPLEVPQVCGPTTVGLAPCAPANVSVLACGPTDLGFPPCAFKTLIKAPKPLGLGDGAAIRTTLSCPDGAAGDGERCGATVDLIDLARAKINALTLEAGVLSQRFANSRTSRGEDFGDIVDATFNAVQFERRAAEWIEFHLSDWLNSNWGEEPLRFLPLSASERSSLIDALRRSGGAHPYGGDPELYDNAFTFNAIVTLVNSLDAALTDLQRVQRDAAKGSNRARPIARPVSAAPFGAARRAADPTRPLLERSVRLPREGRKRVRLKLKPKLVRKLVRQAPRKAPVVAVRLAVSFDAEPRPIVRVVDFPIRIERKRPRR